MALIGWNIKLIRPWLDHLMINIPYFLEERELVHCGIIDSGVPIVGIYVRGVMLGLLVILLVGILY